MSKENVQDSGEQRVSFPFVFKCVGPLEIHFVVLFCSDILKFVYHGWSFCGRLSQSKIQLLVNNIICKVLSLRQSRSDAKKILGSFVKIVLAKSRSSLVFAILSIRTLLS